MKVTGKQLLDLFGLKVGDTVKTDRGIFVVRSDNLKDGLIVQNGVLMSLLYNLLDTEYEIIKPKKKVGEIICKNMRCDNCPLHKINCEGGYNNTLYAILNNWSKEFNIGTENLFYKVLIAELDEEVEE